MTLNLFDSGGTDGVASVEFSMWARFPLHRLAMARYPRIPMTKTTTTMLIVMPAIAPPESLGADSAPEADVTSVAAGVSDE